jgi:NAD(P)-dependent dehydrogenase (short-subunit alcohol dehydrogenase family)
MRYPQTSVTASRSSSSIAQTNAGLRDPGKTRQQIVVVARLVHVDAPLDMMMRINLKGTGVHARSHALVRELSPQRMTVNCIAPGFIADLSVYKDLPDGVPARVLTETPLAGPAARLTQQQWRKARPCRRDFGHRRHLSRKRDRSAGPVREAVTAEGRENP